MELLGSWVLLQGITESKPIWKLWSGSEEYLRCQGLFRAASPDMQAMQMPVSLHAAVDSSFSVLFSSLWSVWPGT